MRVNKGGLTASNPSIDLNKILPRTSSNRLLPQSDTVTKGYPPNSTRSGVASDSPHGSPRPNNDVESQLRAELRQKDEIIEKQEQKISKLVDDHMNTQLEFRKVAYLDDTDLIGSWKALEQRINQLIPRLYDASARDPVSVGQLATLLGKVCGADLVNRPELNSQLRRQLIEAYIWRALLTDVFGASGYIWAGKAHVAIANLRSELEDYERDDLIDGGEYIQWFSRTAALMDFVWRSDPRCSERLRSVARKLRQELRLLEKSNVEEGSVERELMKVVTTACGLDFTMAKSNASYTVFMYDVRDTSPKPPPCKLHGMPFDSENMEDTYYPGAQPWNLRSRVDVVRSPGIIKIGSGLGSEYGKPTVLVKRKVLCLP